MKKVSLILFCAIFLAGCSHAIKPAVFLNGTKIDLELASTPAEQAKGLSGYALLSSREGMLFDFPEKTVQHFWMKDMLFPIDIVWLNDDIVVKISKDLKPEGAKPINIYSSDVPVNNVLEIKAGRAEELKLKINDRVVFSKYQGLFCHSEHSRRIYNPQVYNN